MGWLEHASYLGIFAALLAAGFGIPIPEDIPLLTAGYLCHLGKAHLGIMLPLTLVGVLGCDIILYGVGRRFGDHVLDHRWTGRLFRRDTLDAVKARYHGHSLKIIFAARFMPGARAMFFVSAGSVGIPWWISVPTLVLVGWYLGEKSEALLAEVRHAEHYIAAGIIAITIAAVAFEVRRGRRRKARAAALAATDEPTPRPDATANTANAATVAKDPLATQHADPEHHGTRPPCTPAR